MKRILLVINYPARENLVMQKIKDSILTISPKSVVAIEELYKPRFINKALKFMPDVIMTFPFTGHNIHKQFYIIKWLTNCSICCFRTEGFSVDGEYGEFFSGIADYCDNIVDCEIFWGEEMAEAVGKTLLKDKKLKSSSQIKIAGYPKYENIINEKVDIKTLDQNIISKINSYPKKNVMLFLTGFNYADHTEKDLFTAEDLDLSNGKLEQWLMIVDAFKELRNLWISNIINCAKKYNELLFIVKIHPAEKFLINPYSALNNYSNVIVIRDESTTTNLLKISSVMFHYGSTTVAESAILGVPSVMLQYDCPAFKTEVGKYFQCKAVISDYKVDANNLEDFIKKYLSGDVTCQISQSKIAMLYNIFNIKNYLKMDEYKPSHQIAEILLNIKPCAKIKYNNPYLKAALQYKNINKPFKILNKFIYAKLVKTYRYLTLKSGCNG